MFSVKQIKMSQKVPTFGDSQYRMKLFSLFYSKFNLLRYLKQKVTNGSHKYQGMHSRFRSAFILFHLLGLDVCNLLGLSFTLYLK